MKEQDLFDVMNQIDDDLLKGAGETPRKSKGRALRAVLISSAALILIAALCIGGVFFLKKPNPAPEIAATVYLDVNPSVEVAVDAGKTVLSVNGINDDGKNLPFDGDLVGKTVGEAVNRLVTLIIDKGYLNGQNGMVLLSVASNDDRLANALCNELELSVNALLEEKKPDAELTAQTLEKWEQIVELNERFGVSPGKAKFILNILDRSDAYTTAQLLEYGVADLVRLSNRLGLPDGSGDIGVEEAARIALADAGLTMEDVGRTYGPDETGAVEMKIYHIAFDYEGRHYQYEIDADTGEIMSRFTGAVLLSEEDALAAAAADCGFDADGLEHSEVTYVVEKSFENEAGAIVVKNVYQVYLRDNERHAFITAIDAETGDVRFRKSIPGTLTGEELLQTLRKANSKDEGGITLIRNSNEVAHYVLTCSDGYYHCIVNRFTGEVYYTEVSNSKAEVSKNFDAQYALWKKAAAE